MDSTLVRVRRVREAQEPLRLPKRQTDGSSGLDLMADIDAEVVLQPMQRKLIPTGLALEIPIGFEGQVRPRSGLALRHGLTVLNTPGTIDADYRGEVQVLLINLGDEPVTVQRGDRIAQLVFARVWAADLEEAADLAATDRGAGGFGHTGTK